MSFGGKSVKITPLFEQTSRLGSLILTHHCTYKLSFYLYVKQDKSSKTRRALEKLETMPTWNRIKRYFPRYGRNAAVEKQKLDAKLKKSQSDDVQASMLKNFHRPKH